MQKRLAQPPCPYGRRASRIHHKSPLSRRLFSRTLAIEPLETRALLSATLYLDFGDRFAGADGLTDGGNPVTQSALVAQVSGPQFDVAGDSTLRFTSFAAEAQASGRNANQTAAIRTGIMTLLSRYYEPLDVTIVELTATSQPRQAAATLADIRSALDSANTQDAYVLIAGMTVAPETLDQGLNGQAGGDDATSGGNATDDTVLVLANHLFNNGSANATTGDTAFAYTVAHEASHTFGLEHTANANPGDSRLLTTSDLISQFYDAAGLSDAAADQRNNLNMFTRFPLERAHAAGTYVPYDRLVTNVGVVPNTPAYLTGTGAHDRITISSSGENLAAVTVEPFSDPGFATPAADPYNIADLDITNGILLDAGWGDDLVIVDGRLGKHLDIRGMGGEDRIEVQGFGKAAVATYNPDGATVRGLDGIESFRGDVSISSEGPAPTTIRFTELEPSRFVWIRDVHLLTLTTPNATDLLNVPRPIAGAIEVSGTSGRVQIVPLDVTNALTLVIDAAARDGAGGSPADRIIFDPAVAQNTQVLAGPGNDTIVTGAGDDVIDAGPGNDVARAGGGNDRLLGGSGNDLLDGGAGHDGLDGGAGNDNLSGGPGNDVLRGDTGNDLLSGGADNDVLIGGAGIDQLTAGAGRDLLIGGIGADRLFGEAGEDILIGGTTAHDANDVALLVIMAEWTSNRGIDERIDNLTRGVNSIALVKNVSVFGESARNDLFGGAGADWFILFGNDRARDRTLLIDRIT